MLHLRKPSAALTVSPSALVLLAAFLLLSRGLILPAALLSAALCHELAHVLTLHALHAPPRRLTLSATGAELYVPDLHRLSYGGELHRALHRRPRGLCGGRRCLRRPAGPVPVPDADHRRGAVPAARRPLAGRKRGLAKRRKTG